MPTESGSSDWKQEYLQSLAELEARERQWGETEAFFRQSLSRLSLAADGIDTTLDGRLQDLRDALRSGMDPERLRERIERISESIRDLEDARSDAGPAPGAGSSLLSRLLRRPTKPSDTPQGSEELRLRVAKNLLQELVDDLLGSDAGDALVLRIARASSEAEVYNLGHELVTELGPASAGSETGDRSAAGLEPQEVLLRLLERIDVPTELGARCEDIRSLLLGAGARDRTEEALRAIADLVAEIRGREYEDRAEIEAFLSQVTERLNEIDGVFQESVVTWREGYAEGQALGGKVDDQVNEIEASVGRSQDLESLKGALRQRIEVIRAHMREYRESEQQRLADAEGQVQRLTERLLSVQNESDELRRRLEEERSLALIDPLTGIPNRCAYDERLELEVARWVRYRSPLTLAVWDIDRFKDVNDRYGHQAGDKALARIAQLIRRQIRETDFLARYGGEEFVLLLTETTLDEALAAAENIRQAVMECGFHYRGDPVPITVSCGMTEFRDGDTAPGVFGRADAALYRAKAAGRNRCVPD